MAAEGVLDPDDEYADTSIFENKAGLSDDMRFLASMPELCDVTFLVGETREPVCAVKAVLGARSRFDIRKQESLYEIKVLFREEHTKCSRFVSQGVSKDVVPQRAFQCSKAGFQGVVVGEGPHGEGGEQAEGVYKEEFGASFEHGA